MNLDDWRSRINNLDDEILKLLNQRGTAALRIGELKRQQDLPYFMPRARGPGSRPSGRAQPRSAGRRGHPRDLARDPAPPRCALEHPLPVAYLGPPGTFTHQAATRRFGSSAQLLPVRTIAEIFDEVERGRAEFGVVPVENSTEGAVNVTLDRLIDSELTITGEMTLDIAQHLISRARELARDQGGLLAPAGARPVPGVARRAPAARRRPRRPRRPRGRWSGRATTPRWPPIASDMAAPALRGADPAAAHRGQPVQLDPLPRHRAARRCRPPGATRRRSSSR